MTIAGDFLRTQRGRYADDLEHKRTALKYHEQNAQAMRDDIKYVEGALANFAIAIRVLEGEDAPIDNPPPTADKPEG